MIEDVHHSVWPGHPVRPSPAGALANGRSSRSWTLASPIGGLSRCSVESIVKWSGWQRGGNRIVRYDGANWQALDWNASGISGTGITALHEDHNARLWIGTEAAGIAVYQAGAWRTYDQKSGLSSNRVSSFAEDSKGNVWIGPVDRCFGPRGAELRNSTGRA